MDLIKDIENLSALLVIALFLGVGITGSFHCIGMCGPIALVSRKNKWTQGFYQFGRLVSYIGLFFIFNFIGRDIFVGFLSKWFDELYALMTVFLLMILILQIFKSQLSKVSCNTSLGFLKSIKSQGLRSFIIGLMTILLPCGYLYIVIASTLLLPSKTIALTSVLAFWIGSAPILIIGPELIKKLGRIQLLRNQYMQLCLVIMIGALSLGFRYDKANMFFKSNDQTLKTEKPSCH